MPVYVDIQCASCGAILIDQWSDRVGETHDCGGVFERIWTFTKGPTPGGYPDEKVVVYVSPEEGGKVQWPGRADVPVPERLRQRGYQRMEIAPRELGQFEKRHHVANERRHFDRNGKGF